MREAIAALLREAGWVCECCADVTDIPPAILCQRLDLVLTAAQLPGGDYLAVLQRFRNGAISGAFPVVLLTSDLDQKSVTAALVKGVTEVFAKDNLAALSAYLHTLRPGAKALDGLRALVLDDDVAMGLYLGRVLGELGMTVDCYGTLDAALAAATSTAYDLVISDIVLGDGESGNHFLRLLRQSSGSGRTVPVIAMSGFGDSARRLDALRAGANIYLTKPVEVEELLLSVRRLIGEEVFADAAGVSGDDTAFYNLSRREMAICRLVASGLSDKRIADQLGISYWTVRTHLASTFRKCGVMNRVELTNLLRASEGRDSDETESAAGLAQCLVAALPSAVLVCNRERRVISVNPAFVALTGCEESEAIGKLPQIYDTTRHGPEFFADLWRELEQKGRWTGEIWHRRRDGTSFLAAVDLVRLPPGSPLDAAYAAVTTHVADSDAIVDRARLHALHDPQTGLGNMVMLESAWATEVARARRNRGRLGLLHIGIDRLGQANAAFGSAIRDPWLLAVAGRLSGSVRGHDVVVRAGSDEFVVLASEMDGRDALRELASKLLDALRAPLKIEGIACEVRVSIGMSLYPEDGGDLSVLAARAEAAMRRVCEAGGNAARFYGDTAANGSPRREFNAAFQCDDLELCFLPRVEIDGERVIGAGTLLRRLDSGRPGGTQHVVIDTGSRDARAISAFEWMLGQVCLSLRRLQGRLARRFDMALRVPEAHLLRRGFAIDVATALAQNGVAAERLQLEIAEESWAREPARVASTLMELRQLGVSLALDRFGQDGARLGLFREPVFDTLKLDPALTHGLNGDGRAAPITGAVMRLADELGLRVVADGVDCRDVFDRLRALKCPLAQGPLFGEPLSETQLFARVCA